MPEESPRTVSGWLAGFQPLKSPMTERWRRLVPKRRNGCLLVAGVVLQRVGPELLVGAHVLPSRKR